MRLPYPMRLTHARCWIPALIPSTDWQKVSGTNPAQTYGDYFSDWYGNNYDAYNP